MENRIKEMRDAIYLTDKHKEQCYKNFSRTEEKILDNQRAILTGLIGIAEKIDNHHQQGKAGL